MYGASKKEGEMQDQKTDLQRLKSTPVLQDIQNHPLRGLPIIRGPETKAERAAWLQQLKSNRQISRLYTKSPEEVKIISKG